MKSKTMQACSNNFSLNVRLKCSFASRPCDTVRYRSLTSACWTPIFHQTQNLTYFTEAEGKSDSSRLAPLSFSVWLAVGLREIVVNLSRTWKVLYWLCDAAVGPDSAFDVLILSHWCQSTSAAVILPRGSRLNSMQEIDWQCLTKTSHIKFSLTSERFRVFLRISWQEPGGVKVWNKLGMTM